MGEVVSLGEHKARKLGFPDHVAVGTYTDTNGHKCVRLKPKDEVNGKFVNAVQYAATPKKEEHLYGDVVKDQVLKIQSLLQQGLDVMAYMPQLRSVAAREQAVLDSMKFRERADKLAAKNGWVIRKGNDNEFIISPKE